MSDRATGRCTTGTRASSSNRSEIPTRATFARRVDPLPVAGDGREALAEPIDDLAHAERELLAHVSRAGFLHQAERLGATRRQRSVVAQEPVLPWAGARHLDAQATGAHRVA